ncbi:ABC transporter permease subunit [candidate division KSB1 bacterium]
MRRVTAVAYRELKSYFVSPIAYFVIAIFLLITGYFFYALLSNFVDYTFSSSAQAQYYRTAPPKVNVNMMVIRPLFHNISIVVIFMLPLITMKLFAEEKKQGTIELLLTSPITQLEIILGKYLAAFLLYSAMLLPTVLYMVMLFVYGNPQFTPVLTGYLGLLLLGGSFIAIGILISSLTENQIIAAAVSFGIFLLLWVLSWIAGMASGNLMEILSYVSIINHFDDFAKGVFDTKSLVFYLSFIIFGIYLTFRSIESMRWRG